MSAISSVLSGDTKACGICRVKLNCASLFKVLLMTASPNLLQKGKNLS